RSERFPELATELVGLRVDLIVTRGTPAALAAKNASGTIPVVMAAIGEPIGPGLIASLARPGGNVTGLSAVTEDLAAKRIELLKEVLPRLRRVAALFNMSNPAYNPQWKEIEMMLSELRKYRVSMIFAHQFLTQLDPQVRDAILGNVGTIISFR